MKSTIKVIIGNREKILLWKEFWHPFGPFMDKFGSCINYDMDFGEFSKVESIIDVLKWRWPLANTTYLVKIRISVNFRPSRVKDRTICLPSKNVSFSIHVAWNELRRKKDEAV